MNDIIDKIKQEEKAKKMDNSKVIVQISKTEKEELKKLCNYYDITVSKFIRKLIRETLENEKEKLYMSDSSA